MGVGASISVDA